MNILFIGPYRQVDGWGLAARDYIRALLHTKHNISCKPIFLGQPNSTGLHPIILKTERIVFDNQPNVVIQNVLPSHLDYQHGMINIALCYFETNNLQYTGWIDNLNLMDQVWVASQHEASTLKTDGVTVPIHVVPMPLDCELLNACHDKWPLAYADHSCIFYSIAEYSERKNIEALIIAFYREFYHTEPVQLLLKLHKPGMSEEALYKLLAQDIWNLKKRLRLYRNNWGYNEILLAIQNLSPEHIISMHNQGDCFVMPSRGESLCRPLMDAIYIGNRTIATSNTGMDDINKGEGCWQVKSHLIPSLTSQPPLPYLYTGYETWSEIDIIDLQSCMRQAFNAWQQNPKQKIDRSHIRYNYSYQNIATIIENILS